MKVFTLFFLFLMVIRQVHAALPMDIVFDIDQTIATLIHEGPRGDLLADPEGPHNGIISVTHGDPKSVTEKYRVYEGLREMMTDLRMRQSLGQVRVSFFSGGHGERNRALLDAIKFPDGSSLLDMVTHEGQMRVYNREHMTPTGRGEDARIRERFKKDLRVINPDITDVILIDDIHNFVPDEQIRHVVDLGENFPYPERLYPEDPLKLTPLLVERERNKIYWLTDYLDRAIETRLSKDTPLPEIMARLTKDSKITPFSKNQEPAFERGLVLIGDPSAVCATGMRNALNHLLRSNP